VPGADRVIAALRRRSIPFKFVTNSTGRSRRLLVERLATYGVAATPEDIVTAVRAGVALLKAKHVRVIAPFVAAPALEDLGEFTLAGGTSGRPAAKPDAVVLGDLGRGWSADLLNEAFRAVLDGALLVALQKDRYWLAPTGLDLDVGPYAAALEFATKREALVAGKPNPDFYHAVLASLGPAAQGVQATMIGDDIWSDVQGAQRAGLQGWLVRTGKFRDDVLAASGVRPDRVLPSFGALADEFDV
jgi:HAD superfamily hydrolase (TIGR01458 family)